jgi:hypothetical protein
MLSITLEKFARDPQNKVLSCLYGISEEKKTKITIDLKHK